MAAHRPQDDAGVPRTALAAGVLGIAGALPPAYLSALLLGLSRLDDGTAEPAWALLLVVPVLQVAGAVWLLCRRGWRPMVLASLPATVLLVRAIDGLGAFAVLVGCPVLAAVLALTPSTRSWIAARRTSGRSRNPSRLA